MKKGSVINSGNLNLFLTVIWRIVAVPTENSKIVTNGKFLVVLLWDTEW